MSDDDDRKDDTTPTQSGPEFRRRQRGKNIAVALVIAAFAAIVYVVSIVRMGGA